MSRVLGRSGIKVSEVGFGCWAIGGRVTDDTSGGAEIGWGEVDDTQSAAALRRAFELGITFFDTADVYGTGHSERVLGRALAGHRDEVVIATKFGNTFDAEHRTMTGEDVSPGYIRRACADSLRRLGTDRIDLYQLHRGGLPVARAQEVTGTLEDLVADGMIRSYGWSTDDPRSAAAFASGPHCAAVQHELNVLADAPAMLEVCQACDIASINRGPLAMGLLTGKYHAASQLPAGDVRGLGGPSWMGYFTDGRPAAEPLARLAAVRDVLTDGGRTLAQGALSWLLARSPRTVPIPGIRTVAQAEQNAAALQLGPLPATALAEIDRLLGD
ncbi:MAG TPA: aldo/keto reductase [Streptosporangiaceae bacterium]|jgi:aryl-alcohol dehydrogenase-like predicted oxidoreductase